jgi:hypothetical protein
MASMTGAAGPSLDGTVVKDVLDMKASGENLLRADRWRPVGEGFQRKGSMLICDSGGNDGAVRGVSQSVELNQTRPEPIRAVAWSRAEAVARGPSAAASDYAVYLDLTYDDGTPLYGQATSFKLGNHDWQRSQVVVLPQRPVKRLTFYLLFRKHSGRALFQDAALDVIRTPLGASTFDGVAVVCKAPPREGFQVRDVAAQGPFVRIDRRAVGLKLDCRTSRQNGATLFDVTLADTTGKDRAVTLVYALPVEPAGLRWLDDPRQGSPVRPGAEAISATSFHAGLGRLSRWPLAAVADARQGTALGVDMLHPAFYRLAYNAGTGELFLAYDIGLTPEKPAARVRFCRYTFAPQWGFRAALAEFYDIFPEQFRCRTPQQGLWMPFAKISRVKGWEDFGFKFKEGNDETRWDDAHGILTFRYTEPMTWWMAMPRDMPRTVEAAVAEARRLAGKGNRQAEALLASGYHDASGQFAARLLDTPWCNGAVWSMNSMPGIRGPATDFSNKWNAAIRDKFYGPGRAGDLDGEYIDSSEGYVTDELDFCRAHFAAADTPLCFAPDTWQPAIFRGLVAFEYVRGIAADVHRMGRLMMANGAPTRLCWLTPLLEVLGTETNWHSHGRWQPMSDGEMLYRRALCKGKPYCFLMNTAFEEFPPDMVQRYMKRSLAYGMFPGFFSHNASEGHYFTRPELYERDRPLFLKYLPLCKRVAEGGWEPITAAHSSDAKVYVERFGQRYLTVFNDGPQPRSVTITRDTRVTSAGRELVSGHTISWRDGKCQLTLGGEDVAVLELP